MKNIVKLTIIPTMMLSFFSVLSGCDNKEDITQVSEEINNAQKLIVAFENKQKEITLTDNISLTKAINIDYTVVLNLNNKTISMVNDTIGDGVFHVIKDGNLTINGDGTINSASKDNDYGMAIWADGGNVTINGGIYTNIGSKSLDSSNRINNNEVIYAKNGSIVTINGGTFIGNNNKWVLNSHDSLTGIFIVKGGSFKNFDPSSTQTEPQGVNNNFVAEGYKVDVNGDWYIVNKS